ncbi:MAG: hypothetical protein MRJ68_22505 [Nitrospira sp.]|nr:hypothetical protein [Nitrospira sp.]
MPRSRKRWSSSSFDRLEEESSQGFVLQALLRGRCVVQMGAQCGPEGWDVHDGNTLNVSENEKIVVGRDEACGMPCHSTFQKFVIVWISAPLDAHNRYHKLPSSTDEQNQGASLGCGEAQLSQDLRTLQTRSISFRVASENSSSNRESIHAS